MRHYKRVVVLGFDGLDPALTSRLIAAGRLPTFARLRDGGTVTSLGTTWPAQTPVAWSTFATGVNPGEHGIFDFLRRDPQTYTVQSGLARFEQRSALLPATALNLRGGQVFWEALGEQGIESTVIRCPCTFPAQRSQGRSLSGMGVPDIRGGFGTSTFFTTDRNAMSGESERCVRLDGTGPMYHTRLLGPRLSGRDASVELRVDCGTTHATVSWGRGEGVHLVRGEWSPWLRMRFRTSAVSYIRGIVRLLLVDTTPHVGLYASAVHFDPSAPQFPISHPWDYAGSLAKLIGPYGTSGFVEEHAGVSNGRFDEDAFLAHALDTWAEREAMCDAARERQQEGLVFCLFDTPDRLQHIFWRFGEPGHPANKERSALARGRDVIEDAYVRCDAYVQRVLAESPNDTLVVALSDHGFASFQRGVDLNRWLVETGYLAVKPGMSLGDPAGDWLDGIDWAKTRAYSLGLGNIYCNVKGREGEGTVSTRDQQALSSEIASRVLTLTDPDRETAPVFAVALRDEVYRGARLQEAPDLIVGFAPGYRASWRSAIGGVGAEVVADNARAWSGDHVMAPSLVPGLLAANAALGGDHPHLRDLAPTIASALGVPCDATWEGQSLWIP